MSQSISEVLLSDARAVLVRDASTAATVGGLEQAIIAWLLPNEREDQGELTAVQEAASAVGAARSYQDVALLGFAAETGDLTAEQRGALRSGLTWVSKRPALVQGTPVGFYEDAVGLLGIVLGTKVLADQDVEKEVREWLTGFIDAAYLGRLVPVWKQCLFAAVKQVAGLKPELKVPSDGDAADVRIVLRRRGLLPAASQAVEEEDARLLLTAMKRVSTRSDGIRSAWMLAAFDAIADAAPTIAVNHITLEEVAELLRRVPAGLKRWTWEEKGRTRGSEARQWHIDNEYHVQNLLYAVLAPIFKDLKEEEYTPSVGPVQPRADLGIPSLRLVIEVKFARASATFSKVIEEVSADTNLYLQPDSPYDTMIAFVWDDARRTEDHSLLITGLKKLPGVIDAVVVSRPAKMDGDSPT